MRALDTLDLRASGLAARARPATGSEWGVAGHPSLRSFRIPDGAEAGTPVELTERGDGRLGSDARADVRLMVAHGVAPATPPCRTTASATCATCSTPATCWS